MPQAHDEKAVEDRVISAIKGGDVKMRSRSYFVLQKTLGTVIALLLLAFLVYLISFVVFILHKTGAWFAVDAGTTGWYAFFSAVPWSLLLISLALILVLVILLRRYEFIYHYPLIYGLLALLVIVGIGGLIVAGTSFQARISAYTLDNGTPLVGTFYQFYGVEASTGFAHEGQISTLAKNGFIMEDQARNTEVAVFPSETAFTSSGKFNVGDIVVVFGEEDMNRIITAQGVERIGTAPVIKN